MHRSVIRCYYLVNISRYRSLVGGEALLMMAKVSKGALVKEKF